AMPHASMVAPTPSAGEVARTAPKPAGPVIRAMARRALTVAAHAPTMPNRSIQPWPSSAAIDARAMAPPHSAPRTGAAIPWRRAATAATAMAAIDSAHTRSPRPSAARTDAAATYTTAAMAAVARRTSSGARGPSRGPAGRADEAIFARLYHESPR